MSQSVAGRTRFRRLLGFALSVFLLAVTVSLRSRVQEAPPAVAPHEPPLKLITFSHRQHVTDVGLDCQLCHAYARRGPVAGIPSVARCAGCHRFVLPGSPEVKKILAHLEAEEPIPWVRVHDLPEFVRFTHKRHVHAGVTCQTCHGDVARMELATRVVPLTMDWCVSCHEERNAPLDCLTCHY